MHSKWLAIVMLACAAAILGGCDDPEPIRSYRAPKPEAMDRRGEFDGQAAARSDRQRAGPHAPPAIRYQVPDRWREKPAEPMRRAAFDALADGHAAAEVSVVFLRMALDVAANVNRWLGQIGREPVEPDRAAELVAPGPLDEPATSRRVVLHGDERSIAVAMVERDGGWWFIKMIGARPVVEAQTATLWAFVRSIEFGPAEADAAPSGSTPPPPAGTPGMLDAEGGADG